ncbi:hypothetical protein ElyMa_006298000 [Elysia marginata]|uniref:Uncharacterized protein n=1 Tax=Elysia marginata TaxID=1093978 RepID=A0AAV4HGB7_9GAST|nr:hypothetical protein ElyMa_006298000 [Elysia marginata]
MWWFSKDEAASPSTSVNCDPDPTITLTETSSSSCTKKTGKVSRGCQPKKAKCRGSRGRPSKRYVPVRTSKKNQPDKPGMLTRAAHVLGIPRLHKYFCTKRIKSSLTQKRRTRKAKKKGDGKPTPTMHHPGHNSPTLMQRTIQVAKAAWAIKPKVRNKKRSRRRAKTCKKA